MPDQSSAAGATTEPRHGRRILAIWAVLAVIADPLFYIFAGPHMPPGDMTSSAAGAQFDFNVLTMAALPVILGVWTYGAYTLFTWRAGRGLPDPVSGPTSRSSMKIQVAWIGTTSFVVVSAFVFGTVELVVPAGAGGGEGPQPIWTPTSKTILPVQVIAQQWKFTYRYPTYGGFETDKLVIPDHTTIAFHVTSLDVIHDFWAYQLGVKADANPGTDNVAFTTTRATGSVTVRCDELCGIWHGAMFNYGKIVSKSQFQQWATSTETQLSAATKLLPPFAWSYTPSANGAGGGYYAGNTSPYSGVETYGANAVSATRAAAKAS
jgi:cytochrome c oxidase subunit 2